MPTIYEIAPAAAPWPPSRALLSPLHHKPMNAATNFSSYSALKDAISHSIISKITWIFFKNFGAARGFPPITPIIDIAAVSTSSLAANSPFKLLPRGTLPV
eukprot:scaffold8536_cov36-Cyclotella_meneghiniana.AAC.1